ncbi:MAG: tRNA uridine-5-carboxymethylaminomethyl(34) synthesis GTPase MnmE [Bacteroidetes bacterium HGW-Bacteroidetes-21]|nr:MAG: tRNA uridine-5-carboxymethylaminomethyl(34) synthesis GTPase MnmE [Bacteroidetes bacterium HGW-Bacteroidetes-21]
MYEILKLSLQKNTVSKTHSDTICAIATPQGSGAISVLRVSGKDTRKVVGKLFQPTSQGLQIKTIPANLMVYGHIFEEKRIVDEVMVAFFDAPRSYTGENSAEISCHGSEFIQKDILRILIKHGARPALPGEFTQRAFLNGKLDLAQAEAVADLIASDSEASHKIALQQMRGGISNELIALREKLLGFASLIELEIDFSGEDVEFADRKNLLTLLQEIRQHLQSLVSSFALGNAMKSGIPVVIAGPVNAGKSTLLNALLNEDRAIVSDIPGTTRDVVEDSMTLNGVKIRFADTAGLRSTKDTIENLGIDRTYQYAGKASLILFLSTPEENPDTIKKTLEKLVKTKGPKIPVIHLINKSEKINDAEKKKLLITLNYVPADAHLFISAKFKKGLQELTSSMTEILQLHRLQSNEVLVSNLRHLNALNQALEACIRTQKAFDQNLSTDLIAQEIRQINHHLGEITGQITDSEILKNIFGKFCVGK